MSSKQVGHSHIVTRGSMKLAHNLDDRQERHRVSLTTDQKEEVEKAMALQAEVLRRFPNLAKLLK